MGKFEKSTSSHLRANNSLRHYGIERLFFRRILLGGTNHEF